jgi:uncharacterized SAM-binding protein YcdF (DUF218 family)
MRRVIPKTSRVFKVSLIILILIGISYVFRNSILCTVGQYLDNSDPNQKVEALFVLGGSPVDRGAAAANCFNQGLVENEIICTGANIAGALAAFKIHATEAEMTNNVLLNNGVPPERIKELPRSTSTFEEASEVLNYTKSHKWKKIGVLSSEYHTRRVSFTFNKAFKDQNIEVIYFSANSKHFNPEDWWKNEDGFLTCFSEYLKLCFYILNH